MLLDWLCPLFTPPLSRRTASVNDDKEQAECVYLPSIRPTLLSELLHLALCGIPAFQLGDRTSSVRNIRTEHGCAKIRRFLWAIYAHLDPEEVRPAR